MDTPQAGRREKRSPHHRSFSRRRIRARARDVLPFRRRDLRPRRAPANRTGSPATSSRSVPSRAASSSRWRWALRPASSARHRSVRLAERRPARSLHGQLRGARLGARALLALESSSRDMTPEALRAKLVSGSVRFIHIDGEHDCDSLAKISNSRFGASPARHHRARRHAASRLSDADHWRCSTFSSAIPKWRCCASSIARTSSPRRSS